MEFGGNCCFELSTSKTGAKYQIERKNVCTVQRRQSSPKLDIRIRFLLSRARSDMCVHFDSNQSRRVVTYHKSVICHWKLLHLFCTRVLSWISLTKRLQVSHISSRLLHGYDAGPPLDTHRKLFGGIPYYVKQLFYPFSSNKMLHNFCRRQSNLKFVYFQRFDEFLTASVNRGPRNTFVSCCSSLYFSPKSVKTRTLAV